ncbi:response regulator transcription factor [Proteinivorax hydrogeniformans]|uniref:Stage 0 sporulation protein A homolog n=1 Tax=Proteinivorax hydrogeniformans TaxID=1826727 RepID=A0AAU8HW95_9FIRM
MDKKILVVEDENSILELIKFNLEKEGHSVITATDGEQAVFKAKEYKPNLIVLDIMLPKLDGIEVCKRIRESLGFSVYIIMLTAKGEEIDKIIGLEVGADDYMTKPFSPRELNVRIKAAFRRLDFKTVEEKNICKGEFVINKEQYSCTYKGTLLNLTPKQFTLLAYLVENEEKVCTREELLSQVWGYDYLGDSRTVDVHVRQIRQILAETSKVDEVPIKTLRGVGYSYRGNE